MSALPLKADMAQCGWHFRSVPIADAFNTAEGWSQDVTEDIAREMLDLAHRKAEPLSKSAQAFVESDGPKLTARITTRATPSHPQSLPSCHRERVRCEPNRDKS